MKDYAKHAIWIYGVIVGLSFREAILGFSHNRTDSSTYHEFVEVVRFLVFFFIASTFYLGAAHFFEDIHGPGSHIKYAPTRKRFGLDFMMGLIHFTFFFGWAAQISNHTIWIFGVSPSLLWLFGILLYDVVWFVISTELATRNLIGRWTGLSVLSSALGILGFVVIRSSYELGAALRGWSIVSEHASASSELVALTGVVWIMAYDFRALIHGEAVFPKWVRKFVSMFEDESMDPARR